MYDLLAVTVKCNRESFKVLSLFFFFVARGENETTEQTSQKWFSSNPDYQTSFPRGFQKKTNKKKLPNAIKIQCFIAGMKWVFQVRLVKLDIVTLTTRITKLNLNGWYCKIKSPAPLFIP